MVDFTCELLTEFRYTRMLFVTVSFISYEIAVNVNI